MLRRGSLTELATELERQKQNSLDIVARSDAIKAVARDEHGIELIVGEEVGQNKEVSRHFPLTEYAHKQLSEKMGIPQRYYDRMRETNNYDLLAKNVNTWMATKERRLVRVLDGNVRAILSDKYRPIDNYDLLWSFLDVAKRYKEQGHNIEIHSCDVTETRMYVKAMTPTLSQIKEGDDVQAMVLLMNSEVGASRMAVSLGMWRLICKNGMWGEDIVSRVHLGAKLELGLIEWSENTLKANDQALFAQVKDTVRTAFEPDLWNGFVSRARNAADTKLEGNAVEIVDLITPRLNTTERERNALIEMFAQEMATPAGKTQWGLANAVTRLARDTEDADRQVELEILGGELMQDPSIVKSLVKVEA